MFRVVPLFLTTTISLITTLCLSPLAYSEETFEPTLERGAKVYVERCTLCHGRKGMGEGMLPLLLKVYPNTNLVNTEQLTEESIRSAVALGVSREDLSSFSPPFGRELTWTNLESVILFVTYLREENETAITLVDDFMNKQDPSKHLGRRIYKAQCTLCHGKFAEGDGRMARIIRNPSPADLTASRLPEGYLYDIIYKGGEKMSRSPKMPPWGDQFTEVQMQSIILYLISIRD